MIRLSPSILSADFANLERDIKIAENAGAQFIHIDVMDGHFVPNITIGAGVVKAISKFATATLDVHLMIEEPDKYIKDFIDAGADILTIHLESTGDTMAQIKMIKELGAKASISIKPNTDVHDLLPYLPELDMVLIMTVEPGFGGQGYIESCSEKIRFVRDEITKNNYDCLLEIDGGAKQNNVREIISHGADVIVAGSAVFGGDIVGNVREFLEIFEGF